MRRARAKCRHRRRGHCTTLPGIIRPDTSVCTQQTAVGFLLVTEHCARCVCSKLWKRCQQNSNKQFGKVGDQGFLRVESKPRCMLAKCCDRFGLRVHILNGDSVSPTEKKTKAKTKRAWRARVIRVLFPLKTQRELESCSEERKRKASKVEFYRFSTAP